MSALSLYIHIPYCAKKCAYCDFPSYTGKMGTARAYIGRVLREAEEKRIPGREISTLYIGGGTPSLLPPAVMKELLSGLKERFTFEKDAECSSEANPGMLSDKMAYTLAEGGINRVSLGLQAVQPRLLSVLGRLHTFEDAERSVKRLREAGITNLNLDVMFGLPGQTVNDFRETLEAALSLSPRHLSCYALIAEEGTEITRRIRSGELSLPDEDEEREMYSLAKAKTAARGMRQYEISNFALPGFECRHNVLCWQRREYLGLGAAACGFTGDTRCRNPVTVEGYLAGEKAEEETISPREARFESMMLGLRMNEGVSREAFYQMHGLTPEQAFGEKLIQALESGLLEEENGYFRPTERGMDLQNRLLLMLMD